MKTIINLKKMSFLLAVIILTCSNSFAQEKRQPPIPDSLQIAKMVSELTTELQLTIVQSNQIEILLFNHFSDVKTKLEANKAVKEEQRKEMDRLRSDFNKEVKELLSPEQHEKFIAFEKERHPDKKHQPNKKPLKKR